MEYAAQENMLIDLSRSNVKGLSVEQKLSPLVYYATYLDPAYQNRIAIDSPKKMYLIKNESGIYVSSVYDAGNDLQWFVLPTYRGQGHLTNALKLTILPHLFNSRESQTITINEGQIDKKMYLASHTVAIKCGFQKLRESELQHTYLIKNGIALLTSI